MDNQFIQLYGWYGRFNNHSNDFPFLLTNFLALFSLIDEQFQFLSLVVLSLFLAFIKYNRPKAKDFSLGILALFLVVTLLVSF